MKSIYIYGASGHGLVVADIAKSCGYTDIIFVDDGNNDYPSFDDIKKTNHIPIALGIGSNTIREKLLKKILDNNFNVITLIHPSAMISSSVAIDIGTTIMPHVVINAMSIIGKGCIINTGSIIEHDNIIENFVHVSPNVALAGNVKIGQFSHIGIGTSIIQGITIGKNCIIGAGSIVVKKITNNRKAYGNPCKVVKEIE